MPFDEGGSGANPARPARHRYEGGGGVVRPSGPAAGLAAPAPRLSPGPGLGQWRHLSQSAADRAAAAAAGGLVG